MAALFSITLTVLVVGIASGSPQAVLKYGVKREFASCSAPLECAEPLYCLEASGGAYRCARKPCSGGGLCRIGQVCAESGFCVRLSCTSSADCAGTQVCSFGGLCSNKGTRDQKCERHEQCWSDDCQNGLCTGASIFERAYRRVTAGGIVGIVFAAFIFLLLLLLLIFCIFRSCSGAK